MDELRLDPNVELFKQGDDVTVLVRNSESAALRLRGISCRLIDQVAVGCARQDLCSYLLSLGCSSGREDQIVDQFLSKLENWGALRCSATTEKPSAFENPRYRDVTFPRFSAFVVSAARAITWNKSAVATVAIASVGLGTGLIAVSLSKGLLFSLDKNMAISALWGLSGILPWILLHELAHAVAFCFFGFDSLQAGIRIRKYRLPSPFIRAKYFFSCTSKLARVIVPLSGPCLDLVFLGITCAFLLLLEDGALRNSFSVLFLVVFYGFYMNLNPWRASDGKNALSAFSDDFAVQSKPGSRRLFRVLLGIYLLGFLGLLLSIFNVVQQVFGQ